MLRAEPEHGAVKALRALGLESGVELWFGLELAIVNVPEEHLAAYCRLLDTHVDELPAWRWFKVDGLPSSEQPVPGLSCGLSPPRP